MKNLFKVVKCKNTNQVFILGDYIEYNHRTKLGDYYMDEGGDVVYKIFIEFIWGSSIGRHAYPLNKYLELKVREFYEK